VVGVAVGRRRDEEHQVGRPVGRAEVDLGVEPGEGQRGLGDRLGAAVRDGDAAGQAGGGLRLAGHRVAVQGLAAGRAAGASDEVGQSADDRALVGAQVGVERDQVGGDQ
jgi:hypothetical protein